VDLAFTGADCCSLLVFIWAKVTKSCLGMDNSPIAEAVNTPKWDFVDFNALAITRR